MIDYVVNHGIIEQSLTCQYSVPCQNIPWQGALLTWYFFSYCHGTCSHKPLKSLQFCLQCYIFSTSPSLCWCEIGWRCSSRFQVWMKRLFPNSRVVQSVWDDTLADRLLNTKVNSSTSTVVIVVCIDAFLTSWCVIYGVSNWKNMYIKYTEQPCMYVQD